MSVEPAAPIDRTSRALAERLELALAPYAIDAALMTVLLNALVRRGYDPTIIA